MRAADGRVDRVECNKSRSHWYAFAIRTYLSTHMRIIGIKSTYRLPSAQDWRRWTESRLGIDDGGDARRVRNGVLKYQHVYFTQPNSRVEEVYQVEPS